MATEKRILNLQAQRDQLAAELRDWGDVRDAMPECAAQSWLSSILVRVNRLEHEVAVLVRKVEG